MSISPNDQPRKHIGIAIQMGQPFGHHHGCYKGILDFIRQHRPGWRTSVDPYMTGLHSDSGQPEYDGIVGRISKEAADQARVQNIPAVNHWVNSPTEGLPSVFTDYRACGKMVADHFLEQGYRRIGLISWETDRAKPLYLAGLEQQAKQRGIQIQGLDLPYGFEDDPVLFKQFQNNLRGMLQSLTPPVGLYVPMDAMALYVIQMCDELGLRIPHDVGIAVFYNAVTLCLNTRPTLTSIEASDEQVGYDAMKLLDQLISGEAEEPIEPVLIAPRALRVRGSSEVFVSEDEVVSSAMRFIATNARQIITVEEVANAAKVSKRTLSRRFAEHVGQPVHAEISRIRVQTIMQTLIDTELPISEVAESCGFSTTSHFNVFFRKATGQTPGEYRRKHRAGQ